MPGTIDVYTFDLDGPDLDLDRLWSLLDHEEAQRAEQFRSETSRKRYIARHGQLRKLLSEYLDESPQSIRLICNEFGKPFLRDGDLQFNLSHSVNVCLVTIAHDRELGCDVEWRDPAFPSADIAQAF